MKKSVSEIVNTSKNLRSFGSFKKMFIYALLDKIKNEIIQLFSCSYVNHNKIESKFKKRDYMFENVKFPEGMNAEVLEHLMHPKNYGKLDNANGIGVATDEKTGEYVIFYTLLEDDIIKDVRYATNGCQDTVVIGSMFSEMIKNNDLEYANTAIQKMNDKLGNLSKEQQVCADIVFSAFIASIKNHENLSNGQKEELHVVKMKESCETQENQNG